MALPLDETRLPLTKTEPVEGRLNAEVELLAREDVAVLLSKVFDAAVPRFVRLPLIAVTGEEETPKGFTVERLDPAALTPDIPLLKTDPEGLP